MGVGGVGGSICQRTLLVTTTFPRPPRSVLGIGRQQFCYSGLYDRTTPITHVDPYIYGTGQYNGDSTSIHHHRTTTQISGRVVLPPGHDICFARLCASSSLPPCTYLKFSVHVRTDTRIFCRDYAYISVVVRYARITAKSEITLDRFRQPSTNQIVVFHYKIPKRRIFWQSLSTKH